MYVGSVDFLQLELPVFCALTLVAAKSWVGYVQKFKSSYPSCNRPDASMLSAKKYLCVLTILENTIVIYSLIDQHLWICDFGPSSLGLRTAIKYFGGHN
jgi:hypothetical protein